MTSQPLIGRKALLADLADAVRCEAQAAARTRQALLTAVDDEAGLPELAQAMGLKSKQTVRGRIRAARKSTGDHVMTTVITKTERHAILDEALAIARNLPEDTPLWHALTDDLQERLAAALPAVAILRNCAAASDEIDRDDLDPLAAPISESTHMFRAAADAALRAFIFGRRV